MENPTYELKDFLQWPLLITWITECEIIENVTQKMVNFQLNLWLIFQS
jgi:hypothetical protein